MASKKRSNKMKVKIFETEQKIKNFIEREFDYSDMVEQFENWTDECTFKEFLAGEDDLVDYTYLEFLVDMMYDIKNIHCVVVANDLTISEKLLNYGIVNEQNKFFKDNTPISMCNVEKVLNYKYFSFIKWLDSDGLPCKFTVNKEKGLLV